MFKSDPSPYLRPLALGLFFSLSACASAPSLRVDGEVLERITIENKLLLFDAENELNIAVDARDKVVDEIQQIKSDIRRTKKKKEVAERDADSFEDKGDAERARYSKLKAEAYEKRLDYEDARLDWARERLGQERRRLVVAKAQFELAKAQLVKKNNVPGASDIELADFEEQVKEYKAEVGESDEDVAEAEGKMQEKEQVWVAATDALREASGGALGSRWID